MAKKSLFLDLKIGQSLSIDGGRVVVTLEEKSGQRAKLKFVAEDEVQIQRPQEPIKSGALQAMNGVKVTV
jgi:hypothetical protein